MGHFDYLSDDVVGQDAGLWRRWRAKPIIRITSFGESAAASESGDTRLRWTYCPIKMRDAHIIFICCSMIYERTFAH